MNQIKQMFELQQKLNDATNGLIWTEGATKEGRQMFRGKIRVVFHNLKGDYIVFNAPP
jgi:hypothetical protein